MTTNAFCAMAGSTRLCQWPIAPPAVREMLLLPTGTGGVLYRPSFFHPIVFDKQLLNLTATGDDLSFRLATLARGVPVVTACSSDTLDFTCPIRPPSNVLSGQVHTQQQQLKTRTRKLRSSSDGAKKTSSKGEVAPKEADNYGPSLSTKFNNAGANNVMWTQAVRYLKSRGVLDLSALLQTFAGRERDHCQLLSALPYLGGDKGGSQDQNSSSSTMLKHYDIAVATGELASSVAQHVYDKRCGLVTC